MSDSQATTSKYQARLQRGAARMGMLADDYETVRVARAWVYIAAHVFQQTPHKAETLVQTNLLFGHYEQMNETAARTGLNAGPKADFMMLAGILTGLVSVQNRIAGPQQKRALAEGLGQVFKRRLLCDAYNR